MATVFRPKTSRNPEKCFAVQKSQVVFNALRPFHSCEYSQFMCNSIREMKSNQNLDSSARLRFS